MSAHQMPREPEKPLNINTIRPEHHRHPRRGHSTMIFSIFEQKMRSHWSRGRRLVSAMAILCKNFILKFLHRMAIEIAQ